MKSKMVEEDIHQWELKRQVCSCTTPHCNKVAEHIRYLGGVDISFKKDDVDVNCAALVVYDVVEDKVVYEASRMVRMTEPYCPGFLAFREVPAILPLIEELKNRLDCTFMPQVILVDGNGKLHSREFGLACHLGVELGIPTIGVAKDLYCVHGLERNEDYYAEINKLEGPGSRFELMSKDVKDLHLGCALRTTQSSTKPIFISVGHQISLDTAVWVVMLCSKYRIPEPTRQADVRSREIIRKIKD